VTTFDSWHAITTLLYRYAECIDLADFDGIEALFADAVMTNEGFPGEIRGGAAIGAIYRGFNKVHPDGTLRTRHVTTNAIVDADDDAGTGTSRSYFLVVQCTDRVALQPIVSGRYHDRFERVAGVWRFAHRHILMEAMGDVSDHLQVDVDGLRDR
jgi:3-phenylpropionate/cinnamic acid dioxygenase small subunit